MSLSPEMVYHIPCDCNSHELRVTRWFDDDEEVSLAIWSHGNGSDKWTWKEKLRAIFYILKNGHPYGDQIVISKTKAKSLIEGLTEIVDRMDATEKDKKDGTE